MNFILDKRQRKQLLRSTIYATTGRKVGLTICILFIIATFLVPAYTYLYAPSEPFVGAVMVSIILLFVTLVGVTIFYSLTIASIATRRGEALSINDGVLLYRYNNLSSRYAPYLWVYEIDLRETTVTPGARNQYFFEGGIRIYCPPKYMFIPEIVSISSQEMEEFSGTLEMWDYWQPGLYETITTEKNRLATINVNRGKQPREYMVAGRTGIHF